MLKRREGIRMQMDANSVVHHLMVVGNNLHLEIYSKVLTVVFVC